VNQKKLQCKFHNKATTTSSYLNEFVTKRYKHVTFVDQVFSRLYLRLHYWYSVASVVVVVVVVICNVMYCG